MASGWGSLRDEWPAHQVAMSAYYIDVTETTNMQYKGCVDAKVCAPPTSSPAWADSGNAQKPVSGLYWNQARQYCKWRGSAFDLPTEAQWEMAARGSCEKNGSAAGGADAHQTHAAPTEMKTP